MAYVILRRDAHSRIAAARRKRQWAQIQLAGLAGVSLRTLYALERGSRTRFQEEPVVRVCSHLELDLPAVIQEGPSINSSREQSHAGSNGRHPESPDGPTVQLFVAAPMTSLGRAYSRSNSQIVALVSALERELSLSPIYYAGMGVARLRDLEDQPWTLHDNLSALAASRRFVLIYPRPLPTSALIELGYAMARRIPVRVFVRDWQHLPFMLRSATRQSPETAILRYRTLADVPVLLKEERDFLAIH